MKQALIFDSGVGGLSVVSEIRDRMPDLHLNYVADDLFRPYGTKSEPALRARLPMLLKTLENMLLPDLIVIACNTASVTALPDIRSAVSAPVVGVVPAIKPAAEISQSKAIAVLGTPGTVRRKYVDSLIQDFASDCQIVLKGSNALVELAEQTLAGAHVDKALICNEIDDIFKNAPDIDVIVLACTHFPLLKERLAACAPSHVRWIDSGAAIAKRVESLLSRHTKTELKSKRVYPETAFLIGPSASPQRRVAFQRFGFSKVIGLCP